MIKELTDSVKAAKLKLELAREEYEDAKRELIAEVGTEYRGYGIVVTERERLGAIDKSKIEFILGGSIDIYRKSGTRSVVVELSRRVSDQGANELEELNYG